MDGSEVMASPAAPQLNVTKLSFSSHFAEVQFNMSRDAEVTCGIIDESQEHIMRFPFLPKKKLGFFCQQNRGGFLFVFVCLRIAV